MGRPLRRQPPGQYYLVTTRCHQARFFLRPDRKLNEAVLEWLARAQRVFPGLRIYAVCVMSNHLHLVVRDDTSVLSAWASYFLGNLARAVNRIRGRSGACFGRRYSAEPILDDEALHDRLVYVVTNPVQAALCKRVRQWPGVVLYAEGAGPAQHHINWLDRDGWRPAQPPPGQMHTRGGGEEDHFEAGYLRIDPLPDPEAGPGRVSRAVEAREKALAEQRRATRRKTLTPAQVLGQRWHAAPRMPKRAPRPLCHAADPRLRRAFHQRFREFVDRFREATQRLRQGSPQPNFPDWSYPPGAPLVRPAPSRAG